MTAEKLLPRYTVDEYQSWKGDWELWNGFAIAMSPSPFGRHQKIVSRLLVSISNSLEKAGCQAESVIELDWVVDQSTVIRPDLVIVCGDVPERHLQSPPGLVAEVLSESTRQNDLNFKRDLYESQGVPTYLILDPKSSEVMCHRLMGGRYEIGSHSDHVEVTVCDDCQFQIDIERLFRSS